MGDLPIFNTISHAWEVVKANLGMLVLLFFVSFVVVLIPSGLSTLFDDSAPLALVFNLLSYSVSFIVQIGLIRVGLKAYNGEDISFEDLYSDIGKFISYAIASILYGIIVSIGFMLLIIPGIYLSIRLFFFTIAVVSEDLGPIEALKRSYELTQGNVLSILVLTFMLSLLNFAGVLLLGVGLLITIPIMEIALIHAYFLLGGGESKSSFNDRLIASTSSPAGKESQPNIYDGPAIGPNYLTESEQKDDPFKKQQVKPTEASQPQKPNEFAYPKGTFATPSQSGGIPDLSHELIEVTESPTEYAAKAHENYKLGKYDIAISGYTKAIAIKPENKQYWYSRANSKIKSGDLMGAVDDFTKAIQIDPGFAKAYLYRGIVKKKTGASEGGTADIKRAISIDPELEKLFKKK